jgi:hypothetical protein
VGLPQKIRRVTYEYNNKNWDGPHFAFFETIMSYLPVTAPFSLK